MIDSQMINVLTNFGGLGVLALFAWALLRQSFKQQERLTKVMDNHFKADLENQQLINVALREIILAIRKQNGREIH